MALCLTQVMRVVEHLGDSCEVSIQTMPYEFQRGGNQMLGVRPYVGKEGVVHDGDARSFDGLAPR